MSALRTASCATPASLKSQNAILVARMRPRSARKIASGGADFARAAPRLC
jgi:hypothetical protein